MPNWCANSLTISHENPEQIERVKRAFVNEKLFEEFFPNTGDPDAWYEHNISQWGTKWDVGNKHEDFQDQQDTNTVTLNFDSAWSPPITAYQKFEELGFTVRATYYEPGMCFAGIYEDGFDDLYEYGNMDADEIRDTLPSELDETYGISDSVEEMAEEQESEEDDSEDDQI